MIIEFVTTNRIISDVDKVLRYPRLVLKCQRFSMFCVCFKVFVFVSDVMSLFLMYILFYSFSYKRKLHTILLQYAVITISDINFFEFF